MNGKRHNSREAVVLGGGMSEMYFDTFVNKVLRWSEERGILDHGNFKGQTLKAISEFGELADALAKGDRAALADAIGDVAVCLVNAHWLRTNRRIRQDMPLAAARYPMARALAGFRFMLIDWSKCGETMVLSAIEEIAEENGLDFLDCCKGAWNEIKHRRGYLTPDGLFVKEG